MRFDDSAYLLLGDQLAGLTAERELIVNNDSYRARNVGSMRLQRTVGSELTFTL